MFYLCVSQVFILSNSPSSFICLKNFIFYLIHSRNAKLMSRTMTSAANSLNQLPVEVIRRIASCLAPESALNFLLVCLSVRDFCNDWTVWENIVRSHAGFFSKFSAFEETDHGVWKRYAIAAAKVNHFEYDGHALRWLPQLMASHRTQADSNSRSIRIQEQSLIRP